MKTEAEAIAELSQKPVPHRLTLSDPSGKKVEVLVTPDGSGGYCTETAKEHLDEYATAPDARSGVAQLTELASFIDHAKRFKDVDSALFANPSPSHPSMTAVLDYHRIGAEGAPRFGRHRGLYNFPLAEEWVAWKGSAGKAMSQGDFAKWIEDRIVDIADPSRAGDSAKALVDLLGGSFASPSRLIELSRGLSVRVGAKVANAVNLQTGETNMQFSTTNEDATGAPLKVPSAFLLGIPVFKGGAVYTVAARLRYRIVDGLVVWSYDLHRPDRYFDDAFREACETAKMETGLPLFYGAPEQ